MDSVADRLSTAGRSAGLEREPADLPFLGSLPEPVRERLLGSSCIEHYAPREELFAGGAIPTRLQIVLSGIVELACFYERRECTALMMAAGDVLMPAAVLIRSPISFRRAR